MDDCKQDAREGTQTVDTLHDALWLFIIAPFSTFIAGTGNAIALSAFQLSDWNRFLFVWPTWVLGDLSAILCYMPCILHLWNYFHPSVKPSCSQDPSGYFHGINGKSCSCQCQSTEENKVSLHHDLDIENAVANKTQSSTNDNVQNVIDWPQNHRLRCRNLVYKSSNIVISPSTKNNVPCGYCSYHVNRKGVISQLKAENSLQQDPILNGDHHFVMPSERTPFSIRASFIRVIECVFLFVTLITLSLLIFTTKLNNTNLQRDSYLVFPVVIWASFRFNRVGLPLAVVIVTIIASAGTSSLHPNEHSLLQVRIKWCNIPLLFMKKRRLDLYFKLF